jgi:fatty acid desaturase
MRLTFFVLLQGGMAIGQLTTGLNFLWYFRVLWLLPLVTGFPYFMLLRDAYQHANTDEGRFTNSRVMFPDAFSRWAIFMYGSDIHLTHHLYPTVPHYKLRRLHESLKRNSTQYADEVVETYGTFRRSRQGYPCLIETIENPRA